MIEKITGIIQASIDTKQKVLDDPAMHSTIADVVDVITNAFRDGHRVYFCGNGGSAADAQHLAAEFSGRFYTDRKALPAEALHCNTSYLTAVANDFAYDDVFAFQLRALAQPGDILMAISSSGNSPNILKALEWANANGVRTIAMTGFDGGKAREMAGVALHAAADNYGVVEDVHQSMMHLLAQYLRHRHLDDPSQLGRCRF